MDLPRLLLGPEPRPLHADLVTATSISQLKCLRFHLNRNLKTMWRTGEEASAQWTSVANIWFRSFLITSLENWKIPCPSSARDGLTSPPGRNLGWKRFSKKSFPRYLVPLFQNESVCKTFHMKVSFTSFDTPRGKRHFGNGDEGEDFCIPELSSFGKPGPPN